MATPDAQHSGGADARPANEPGGGRGDVLSVFDPKDAVQALQGWALHTSRRRIIHEMHARFLDMQRLALGTLSTVLAAVAGTSAFAAWQSEGDSTAAAVVTVVVGIGAAILANVLTFLDPGARAEANRRAAVAYKDVLRDYEIALALRKDGDPTPDAGSVATLKQALARADASAPTVPNRLAKRVERRPFVFVPTADQLWPNPRADKTTKAETLAL
jgi:hypothetical protein